MARRRWWGIPRSRPGCPAGARRPPRGRRRRRPGRASCRSSRARRSAQATTMPAAFQGGLVGLGAGHGDRAGMVHVVTGGGPRWCRRQRRRPAGRAPPRSRTGRARCGSGARTGIRWSPSAWPWARAGRPPAGAGPRPAAPAVGRPLRARVTTAQGSFLPAGCSKRTWSKGDAPLLGELQAGLGGPALGVHAHALGRADLGLALVGLGHGQARGCARPACAASRSARRRARPGGCPRSRGLEPVGELVGQGAQEARGDLLAVDFQQQGRVSLMPSPPLPGPLQAWPAPVPRGPGRRRRRGRGSA